MKPLLLVALSLSAFSGLASAQAPIAELPTPPVPVPSPLEVGEIALEGEVKAINGATGEITILATAFSTPTGRKTLPAPKAKTLVTTAQTRFLDLRLNLGYALSDLNIGLQVRAVGRDGGSGKPMQARLLEWRSVQPPIPPDPDTPASLASLLPPPQNSKGVKVRVVDAGVQPENRVFDWSNETRPVFFVSYRVLAPRETQTNRPYYEWGNLKGLRSPDGVFLHSSGAGWNGKTGQGRTLSFPKVNPRWKSVTAIFETTSPDANADSSGRFRGAFVLSGALPTKANPKTTPGTQVRTPHGTILTLSSIECDFDKKITTYVVGIKKPDGVPDVSISADFQDFVDDQKRSLRTGRSSGNGSEKQHSIQVWNVPEEGAKEVSITLAVTEQAESWKQKDAYNTLEIELPVAALVGANPPARSVPLPADDPKALPVWEAQNDGFSTRIESSSKFDGQSFRGMVWVAAKPKTDEGAVQTLVETVAWPEALRVRTADGTMRQLVLHGQEVDDAFFHSDGALPAPGETGMLFNENGYEKFGEETALSLDVRTFKRLRFEVNAKGVAIAPDTQRALDEPIGDGALMLRKIAWLSGDALDKIALRTAGEFTIKGKSALVLVFSRTPIAPKSQMKLDFLSVRDDTGQTQTSGATTWNGDALSGEIENVWTVVVPAPTEGTKSLDIRLRATETGPNEATATVEFPGIKLQKPKA